MIAPLYTGGPVAVTPDGNKLVTCVGEDVVLTDVKAGIEICRFVGVRGKWLLFRARLLTFLIGHRIHNRTMHLTIRDTPVYLHICVGFTHL